jgi:hypothetical protein
MSVRNINSEYSQEKLKYAIPEGSLQLLATALPTTSKISSR